MPPPSARRLQSRDLSVKLQLKWAAIAALPTAARKAEALVVDEEVPLRARLPTVTPPLKGFVAPTASELPEPTGTTPTSGGADARPVSGSARAGKSASAAVGESLAAALRRGRGRSASDAMFDADGGDALAAMAQASGLGGAAGSGGSGGGSGGAKAAGAAGSGGGGKAGGGPAGAASGDKPKQQGGDKGKAPAGGKAGGGGGKGGGGKK